MKNAVAECVKHLARSAANKPAARPRNRVETLPAGTVDAARMLHKRALRLLHQRPSQRGTAAGLAQTAAPLVRLPPLLADAGAVGRARTQPPLLMRKPMAADAAAAVGGVADAAAPPKPLLPLTKLNSHQSLLIEAEPGADAMARPPSRSGVNPLAAKIAAATMAKPAMVGATDNIAMVAGMVNTAMAGPTPAVMTATTVAVMATATDHATAPGGKVAVIGAAMMTGGATGAVMTGRVIAVITAAGIAIGGAIAGMTGTIIAGPTAAASASGSTMPLTATIPTVGSRSATSSIRCS